MTFLIAHLDTPRWIGPVYEEHAEAEAVLDQINRARRHHHMPPCNLYRIVSMEGEE